MPIRQRQNNGTPAAMGLSRYDARPAATTDTLTIERVDVPETAVPGEGVTVTATVSCQASPFTQCEAALRFTLGNQQVRVPQAGNRSIGEAAQDKFQATFNMPPDSTSVVVDALEQGSLGRWNVEDSAEVPIEAVTRQEKRQQQVLEFVPWALGGGAVGGGAAQLSNRNLVGGGVAGVGAGIATKLVADNIGGLGIGGLIPEFPTTAVLATAALLGAGALLLWRVQPGGLSLSSLGSRVG
jgi:hypothetical protein